MKLNMQMLKENFEKMKAEAIKDLPDKKLEKLKEINECNIKNRPLK